VEHLGAAGNVVRVLNRTAGAYARVSDAGPLVQGAFKASYSQERELDPNAGGYTFLTAYASDGSPMFMINHHSNNSTYIQLYYWTGSGAWTGGPHLYFGTQYGAIPRVRLTEMAFEWNIANVGGYVRFFWGGLLLGEISGDTLLSNSAAAANGIHGFALGGGTGFYQNIQYGYWSEIMCGTESLRGHRMYSAPLTGAAGAVNTMATGTPADIDEAVLSLADSMTASAAGQKYSAPVTLPATIPGGVAAVGITSVAAASAGGPQSLAGVFRLNGVEHVGVASSLSTDIRGQTRVITAHPAGGALRAAHLANLELGHQAVA
jgi:hypothetical protein